jgi:peptidoglycan/LPS O-acetylase OafA/YrhL
LVGQGTAWVAIFFVLLGFVNSLKAVQLARVGATNDALNSLATSTFRRTGRLVFPAAAVTVLAWFFCQLGAFDLASRTDAYWIRTTSPLPSPSWSRAVDDLIRQLIRTWVEAENAYDQPQWALLNLFKGSLYVFTALLATVNTTPRFRLCAEIVLYMWCWAKNDAIVGINVFGGMILAELSFMRQSMPKSKSTLANLLPYLLAILGLYLMSFPDSFYEQAAWSRRLWQIGLVIFPANPLFGRFYAGIGAQILCLAILLSPSMRNVLSNRYLLWLGSMSYPLYLLHGPLLRSVMTYMLFLPASLTFKPDLLEDGTPDPESLIPAPGCLTLFLLLPIFFVFLLAVVRLWAVKVEPYFGAATASFERFARTWGRESVNSPKENNGVLPSFVTKD